jgi:hypothetical protein
MEDYGSTGGGRIGVGGKVTLREPTLTPQQRQAVAQYSAPSPAPSFQRVGALSAIAPVQNYSPASNPYRSDPAPIPQNTTPQQGIGGGGNGAGAQAEQARRPMDYSQFTDDQAATDSVVMDQKSQYANALKKFIEDNNRQSGVLDQDAGVAQQGIARNRTNGLTGLSEDFASRGLTNSGMFATELGNADKQYDKQKEQVTTGLKNAHDDLGFRRAKYEQENGENGSNIQAARREAFARLAASQGLT